MAQVLPVVHTPEQMPKRCSDKYWPTLLGEQLEQSAWNRHLPPVILYTLHECREVFGVAKSDLGENACGPRPLSFPLQ
jgi:hypothetical protein